MGLIFHDTVADESRRLIHTGRALLAEEPGWAGGRADQAALAASLGELEAAVKNADGRLVMGLLGGTGVGKSTLISALAGEPISAASPVRPTTSRPMIYRHEAFPPLAGVNGEEAIHRVENLRNIAIIDFPDFDSLETAHHQLVVGHFRDLDLVAWVTDPNKYADRCFYEMMNRLRGLLGSGAQVALLNKADELRARQDGEQALGYVLANFAQLLRESGQWSGAAPQAVSAAESLAAPGDRAAGGLGPLREMLDNLADAKQRRAVEQGNLAARNASFREQLFRAARPEQWQAEAAALEKLRRDFQPQGAIESDLAALTLGREALVAPRLEHLKRTAGGLLALFTEGWDFTVGRFRPAPDPPPAAPSAGQGETSGPRPSGETPARGLAAPGFVHYILGRSEDFYEIAGRETLINKEGLIRESEAWARNLFNKHLAANPRVSSALLWLWPAALAALLVWAETGGQYGGPAALTAAAIRSAAPWLIFAFLGDLFLSRFIWFRARRRYETAFHRALEQIRSALSAEAEERLGSLIDQAAEKRRRVLKLLADIVEK
ncbi:MAG: 50S ribosome-binding GTPase [Candidatus Adiutrix sp.]|jgi:hypothetical protein|nr:50S ribosome-binding GTPase [Candidatus Adiutrix sp.]